MSGIVCWFVILLIVIIIVVGIILRIWSLMPYKVISNIVNTYDILRNFDKKAAKCLFRMLSSPHVTTYKLYRMEELNILTIKGKTKLSSDAINELMRKRVVIVSVGEECQYALDVAKLLTNDNISVTLVLYDCTIEIEERYHVIHVHTKDISS